MAAFLAWIINSVSGSQTDEVNQEQNIDKTGIANKSQQPKKSKSKEKFHLDQESPQFSTSLKSPIDEIIAAELLNIEELDSNQINNKIIRKRHKASKKSDKLISDSYSNQNTNLVKSKSDTNLQRLVDKKLRVTQQTDLIADDSLEDITSTSFIPVKEKRRFKKSKSEEKQDSVVLSKQSLKTNTNADFKSYQEQHNKNNVRHSVTTGSYKNITTTSQELQHSKPSFSSTTERGLKESKKVVSSVSYASVTVQNFSVLEENKNGNLTEEFEIINKPEDQNIAQETNSEKKLEEQFEFVNINTNGITNQEPTFNNNILNTIVNLEPIAPEILHNSTADEIEIIDIRVGDTEKRSEGVDNPVELSTNAPATQDILNNTSVKKSDLITEDSGTENSSNSKRIIENIDTSDSEHIIVKRAIEDNIMNSNKEVRILELNDGECKESVLYRLEKNWIIQFRLGSSLLGRKVNLYCNYPSEINGKLQKFERTTYQLLSWSQDDGCRHSDDTALFSQINIKVVGSFHYYFTYEDQEHAQHRGSGYLLVDAILTYGNNEQLPLDSIQCQTVLTKNMGAFTTWESKLKVAKESGYNMIHFTPIQELGASNSAYSLSEQLKVNPIFTKNDKSIATFDDIEKLLLKMRKEWKVVSICDIVLNHTANESKWIQVHPEVTYNCNNCSYMRPAYLLDAALYQFSLGVKKGLYEENGIPEIINTEDHLNAVRYYLQNNVVSNLKLEELFICDVNKIVADFLKAARNHTIPVEQSKKPSEPQDLTLIQDPEYRRLSSTVDMVLALKVFNTYRRDCYDEDSRIRKCAEDFKNKLDALNKVAIDKIKDHLNAAVENTVAGIRYFRVQSDGPRVTEISIENPLTTRYFTDHGTPTTVQEHEKIAYSEDSKYLMAHNGWVINADPLKNFAASDSNVYIRRELIAWGDSVKLRFGDKPADCPYLWDYMRKYVEQTAKIFDGVRLDNCHSTPIPVAEYLLDCARNVRPDLYVVAELFTNSDHTDNIFVNKLGITSLIREAMSAWDSHEQGRLVHRYGGYPVGSFYQPNTRPIVPSIAHALFLDLSHDNPSPILKRSVFDLLPSSALINMACCASGSNRGYDELVPHHIHVVEESREYTEWTDDDTLIKKSAKYVSKHSGIIAAKRALNDLHFKLGTEGYSQVYVDQMDPDIVAVTRHCPETHESYILVSFTAFGHPREDADNYQRGIKSLRVEGILDEIVLEATLNRNDPGQGVSRYAKIDLASFKKDEKHINGLPEYAVEIKEHIQLPNSTMLEQGSSDNPNVTVLNFKNFKPGSVVIIKISLPEAMKKAVKQVRNLMAQFSITKRTDLFDIISKMSPADLNRAIYRCDQEEKDEGKGFDVYDIPNYGRLVYSGLQGLISLLSKIRPSNDLGHPLCGNLRDGDWLIDYVWKRLKEDQGTKELGQWLEESTKGLKQVPRYLIPAYFDIIITGVYVLLLERFYEVSSSFVRNGSALVKALSLGSLQFSAYVKSADLPTLSPNLSPPKPPTRNDNGQTVQTCTSLSAGLPHFSVGYMRNWGRDTFIALRGLYILTGRFQDARYHILGYAACLRHGLIPNLLDGGRNPRFNCRDAVWWWLYCIKCYVEEAPKGTSILSDKVSRIFPKDDSPQQEAGKCDQLLSEVIQEVLNVHFQGLSFRERNAGKQIDEHMTDNGFNVQIGVHPETGFVFGGNTDNCGTWMDKMGSSDKAGNRGKPSSPRDGSACEIVGLSKSVISWLHSLHQEKQYRYEGVERIHSNGHKTKWTFKTWADKIQDNFEKYFWINVKPVQGEIRPSLINKRGIYKDSYGASEEWADVQLRCNFPIVMVVAPELFDAKHAWVALQNAEKYLLGPLGMKTLDPEDWAYNGDYDNSNDSNNDKLAHGFNYHQGPEWVWPVGYFLRAKLLFAAKNNKLSETVASTKHVLSKHYTELQSSDWRGLPELTNSNGSYCKDSSRTQAWSMSCILEVLHDLQQLEASLSDNNIKKNICRPAT